MWPASLVADGDPVTAQFLNSTCRLIDETVLGSAATLVTYSGISQRYRHLVVSWDVNADTVACNLHMRLNGDSSAIWGEGGIFVLGATAFNNHDATNAQEMWIGGADTLANGRGSGIVVVSDYSSADRFKVCSSLSMNARLVSGAFAVNSGELTRVTGSWRSLNPVTSISIGNMDAGLSMAAGSKIKLYAMGAK